MSLNIVCHSGHGVWLDSEFQFFHWFCECSWWCLSIRRVFVGLVSLFENQIAINAWLVPLLCHFVPGANSYYLPTSTMEMTLHDLLNARIHWVLEKIGLYKHLDLLVGMQHQGFQCFYNSNSYYLTSSEEVLNSFMWPLCLKPAVFTPLMWSHRKFASLLL